MRVVTSETALKYLEKDIVSVESELEQIDKEIQEQPDLELEFNEVLAYAKYILEHLSEMLLDLCDPLRKAAFFGAIFNKVPTYAEIDLRTHEKSSLPEVNELFRIRNEYKSLYGEPRGYYLELFFTVFEQYDRQTGSIGFSVCRWQRNYSKGGYG